MVAVMVVDDAEFLKHETGFPHRNQLSALTHSAQQRTFRDHTYDRRAESLVEIFESDLLRPLRR